LNQLYRSTELWEIKPTHDVEPKIRGQVTGGIDEAYLDALDAEHGETPGVGDLLEADAISVLRPRTPITVEIDTSVANAIRQMNNHNIGCVLVVDEDGRLAGIFTERDVLGRVTCKVEDLSHARVRDYMTERPWSLRAEDPIRHALHLMSAHGFRHLPLVDGENRPDGIISFRDVVRYLREGL
jgi:CBS domain-containing protein